jgi:ubiquinol-cytochrome c reductase iron-sulfur subunit
MGIFGIVALFPLLRSLGPLPKETLQHTDWRSGSYVVDQTGRRVQVGDLAVGSIETVFPEGTENSDRGQAVDQTVLIRVSNEAFTTKKGRETWAPHGYVAYSKVCTHLGCPVGLYEQELQLLVCPCHQSMFNVTNGAVPQFGPAPRPLPQLPLYVDSSGFLRSQSDYHEAVGPGFWERS